MNNIINTRKKFRRSRESGAAIVTVMIIATVVGVILSVSLILIKAQLAQVNRIGLRIAAERLNNSATELVQQLLTNQTISIDNVGPVGSQHAGFTPQGPLSASPNNKITVLSGNQTEISFNFCGDLTNFSDEDCFPGDTYSTKIILMPATRCNGRACAVGVQAVTRLRNSDTPNKVFRYVNEYSFVVERYN